MQVRDESDVKIHKFVFHTKNNVVHIHFLNL